ncbi:hypothetical protein F5X68DRAFT_223733 [Plectosphaerella plurivora]|uniref:Uncharacterized protein n=1 Tax=Plectosphaerella plurivora TaxID=936078 RepID=A0A9P9A949_9PEZI|nr:hypothetical protein F5X68DRAFT_223733 [Plectosphaerella plurivora]
MATTETLSQPHDRVDRPGRRRPFSTWVRKLTNFNKGSSSNDAARLAADPKRTHKKRGSKKNNPYPQSATINYLNGRATEHQSAQSFVSERSGSATSLDRRRHSDDGQPPHTAGGARSLAPTVATERHSIMAPSSVAGTSRTIGGMDSRRGGDSTFSSPAPSVRSLTTTLTTIQSVAPNLQGAPAAHPNPGHASNQSQTIQFHQPFPTTSPPSAIPAHLAPSSTGPGHPTTYSSATANNLLTDNASILTLASSSKRRRRRSFDTDASVRALAPSSLWGGSRESLPLSVLSSNVDQAGGPSGALHQSSGARANAERTSIYSATGVVPALPSERNSFYYARQRDPTGDGASTRSGILGHGRAESISGSIIGVNSPLSSPRDGARGETAGVEEKDENETDNEATPAADKTNEGER